MKPGYPFGLVAPGLVVNTMKGDADERRAGGWLEWDGALDRLQAVLLGIPFDGASVVRTGSRGGPDAVRQGLMYYTTFSSSDLRDMDGFAAADVGDVPVALTDMARTFERISDAVAGFVGQRIVPIAIGGDHSIAYPCLRGVVRGLGAGSRLGIIHFDAHHDLRAAHLGAESSGVPFRKALETLPEAVHGSNLVQLGMSEFTNSRQLAEYARIQGVTVMPGRDLRRDGVLAGVHQALEIAGNGTDAIYVSVDIDCIDQAQAPGTAAPNPFGLDLRDIQEALRIIGSAPKTVGMDLVEISPPFDRDNMTGRAGASLVLSFLYGLAVRSLG
ncbi:MAG: agmatinase family protein [Acidisphaera sp.]|nr:agmatinase family protein [Acidisphaera sp.]